MFVWNLERRLHTFSALSHTTSTILSPLSAYTRKKFYTCDRHKNDVNTYKRRIKREGMKETDDEKQGIRNAC